MLLYYYYIIICHFAVYVQTPLLDLDKFLMSKIQGWMKASFPLIYRRAVVWDIKVLMFLTLKMFLWTHPEYKPFSRLPEAGNNDGNFGLSLEGELRVLKVLDREEVPAYSIIIKASSNRSWTPPRGQRSVQARALDPALDPSLLEVQIQLEDINDQTPRFTKAEYTAGEPSPQEQVGRCRTRTVALLCFRSCSECQSGLRAHQGVGGRQRRR